jgi:DNA-binding transcriptional ArsR family regulator
MNQEYSRRIPDEWVRVARVFAALGDEQRQRILLTFEPGERLNVGQIAEVSTLSRSTVSHHLKVLREAGLITGEIEGPATCYCVNPEAVRWLKEQVESWLPGCCEPSRGVVPLELKLDGLEVRGCCE